MNERDKELAVESRLLAKHTGGVYTDSLQEFADLIRADEREACAKVVEADEEHRRDASWGYLGGEEGVELLDGKAKAIRARGQA
jgi:hypothetical protein